MNFFVLIIVILLTNIRAQCSTSTTSITQFATDIDGIFVSSQVSSTIIYTEADDFSVLVTFNGLAQANEVFSELVDGSSWNLVIVSSPFSSSSAQSQVYEVYD
jgi:hypothetical protein